MNFLHKVITFALVNFVITTALVFITSNSKGSTKQNLLVNKKPTISPKISKNSSPSIVSPGKIESSANNNASVNESLCIIVIDSEKYDVTEFRNIHSGKDVFNCGTDMTSVFYSRHDKSYLTKMEKYRTR